MTIDSLNASLVKSMPWLSGLGTDVAMDEHAHRLYEEAAWRSLDSSLVNDQVESALQTLLLHLDNNDRRVVRLLCGLLAKRDQWLRYLVPLRSGQAGEHIRQQLTQTFEQVIEEQLEDLHADIPFDIGQDLEPFMRYYQLPLAAASYGRKEISTSLMWYAGNCMKCHCQHWSS